MGIRICPTTGTVLVLQHRLQKRTRKDATMQRPANYNNGNGIDEFFVFESIPTSRSSVSATDTTYSTLASVVSSLYEAQRHSYPTSASASSTSSQWLPLSG
jgi:hypothetical protein